MTAHQDARFMARALRLAEKGRYTTHPNPCVGCVIVNDDEIVGEGFHLQAGEAHAEAAALVVAGEKVKGATVYVTLEPCSFQGRTPSCARTLVEAGVGRVVVATIDPDERNAGSGIRILQDAGVEVSVGVLETSAQSMIRGHVRRWTTGRPYVRLKLAMTADGRTALSSGESRWITSREARRDVQHYRAMSAAIVTGVQTVIDDDPRLSVRADEFDCTYAELSATIKRPVYVLDSNLRIPDGAALLRNPDTVIVSTMENVRDLPVEYLKLPAKGDRVDLEALMETLAHRAHGDVLFECGATLAGALIEAQLLDELILYVAPRLIGDKGRALLNMSEVARMSDLADFTIRDVRRIGPDTRITATFPSR